MKDYAENLNRKEEIINWSLQFSWEKASKEYIEVYNELM
jgi:hypothetical protein